MSSVVRGVYIRGLSWGELPRSHLFGQATWSQLQDLEKSLTPRPGSPRHFLACLADLPWAVLIGRQSFSNCAAGQTASWRKRLTSSNLVYVLGSLQLLLWAGCKLMDGSFL